MTQPNKPDEVFDFADALPSIPPVRKCPCWHDPKNLNMECFCLCCISLQAARTKAYPCGAVPCECMDLAALQIVYKRYLTPSERG